MSETINTPGPGSYFYDKPIGNDAPKHFIASRKDDPSEVQKNKNTPGPGAY